MDAYGPAFSNGLALDEGEDYSDTEVEGNYMVEVESYEGPGPSTPHTKADGATSPMSGTQDKGEKHEKAGDDYNIAPDGEAESNKPGEDYSDEMFESYEMTNNGTQQFITDNATEKNKTKDSSHSEQETNSATELANPNNSSIPNDNNITEKNNTTDSSPPADDNNDYKAYEYKDEESVMKSSGSLDPEVILIMSHIRS